jgi:hypothetical protein
VKTGEKRSGDPKGEESHDLQNKPTSRINGPPTPKQEGKQNNYIYIPPANLMFNLGVNPFDFSSAHMGTRSETFQTFDYQYSK